MFWLKSQCFYIVRDYALILDTIFYLFETMKITIKMFENHIICSKEGGCQLYFKYIGKTVSANFYPYDGQTGVTLLS